MTNKLLKLTILGGCAFLYACGGGGGSDDGDTPPPSETPTPDPVSQQLTITGLVTDKPVSNAEILVTVGSETFSTTADENGNYSVTIDYDTSMASDMVRAEATHTGNPELKLVSLLGSLELLDDIAGDDDMLTGNESTAVNITNLSTSIAGLIEAQGEVTSQDQLEEARKDLSAQTVISIATSIKLVLDYAPEFDLQLPAEVSDTYALAKNFTAAANFANQIQAKAPTLYQDAVGSMLSDTGIVHTDVTEALGEFANTYYFTSAAAGGFVVGLDYSANPGYRLQLNSDGTGELRGSNSSTSLTWQKTTNGIDISDAKLVTYGYEFDNNSSQSIPVNSVLTLDNVRWLDRGSESDLLLLTGAHYTSYPGNQYDDTPSLAYQSVTLAVKSAGVIDAADILKIGQSYSMPLPTQTDSATSTMSVLAMEVLLNGSVDLGGTATITMGSVTEQGTPQSTEIVADWNIDSSGRLEITGDPSYEYTFLTHTDGKAPRVMVSQTQGSYRQTSIDHALLKEAPAWTSAEIEGIYTHPLNYFTPDSRFWFEIRANGKATTFSAEDSNDDGVLSADEVYEMPSLWQITDASDFQMRRYRVPVEGTYCESTEWDPADDANCVLGHEREWKLYQIMDNGSHWIRHYHRYYNDAWRDTSAGDPDSGHVFGFGQIGNIRFEKVANHPVPLSNN